jgi:serine/threonine protein kinase
MAPVAQWNRATEQSRAEALCEKTLLLERRLSVFKDPLNGDHELIKASGSLGTVVKSGSATSSTGSLLSSCHDSSAGEAVPLPIFPAKVKPLSRLQRRRQQLKSRLSIDCDLIRSSGPDGPSFAMLEGIGTRFQVYEELGQGTTGVVFRAERRSDGQEVALKVMRMHDEELLATAKQEYELLRSISHPHIIQALDFFTYPMGVVMVLSYFAGKTLEEAVASTPRKSLPEETSRYLFNALVLAVEYLHQQGIIHRDVKAANVLVACDFSDLKLVDFNTAQRVLEGGSLTMTGTVDYMAPEVLLGESLSEKSDVWAMGLCLHLMLLGSLLVTRQRFSSRADFARALAKEEVLENLEEYQHLSKPCREVLRGCLAVEVKSRFMAAEILASDFLRPPEQPE